MWCVLFQDAACLHLDTTYVLRTKQGQWPSWQCIRCLSVWPGLVGGGCCGRRARWQNTGWAIKPSTGQWASRRPAAATATFRSGGTAPQVQCCVIYNIKEQIFQYLTQILPFFMKLWTGVVNSSSSQDLAPLQMDHSQDLRDASGTWIAQAGWNVAREQITLSVANLQVSVLKNSRQSTFSLFLAP